MHKYTEWRMKQWVDGWSKVLRHTHTHAHPFNGPLSGTTQMSRYQKHKTNLDFTEARDSEWQLYQLDHMQACTSLQADNHASTPPLSFLQAGCSSWRPTVSKHWRQRFTSHLTQNRSFQRHSYQPLSWLGTEKVNPSKLIIQNQSDLN